MTFLSCRNRVKQFGAWKAAFDSHTEARKRAAREFIGNPAAGEAAAGSGVIEGEHHFIESGP